MRILIAGPSGSGKTTFAARLGRLLAIPHTEMDSLHWGPNWTPRPSFEADVQALIEQPAWITEWQYPQVRGRVLERADVVIYLRYSRGLAADVACGSQNGAPCGDGSERCGLIMWSRR